MGFRKVILVVKIIMPLLFLGLGLFVIFNPERLGTASGAGVNNLFGYLLIGYAFFRGFRVWQEFKNQNAE